MTRRVEARSWPGPSSSSVASRHLGSSARDPRREDRIVLDLEPLHCLVSREYTSVVYSKPQRMTDM